MSYIILWGTEDGTQVAVYTTWDEALKFMMDGDPPEFFIPEAGNWDSNYWGDNRYVVIKGDLVLPKQKLIVKEWQEPA